jgi:riboflavin synthase
VFTGIISAVGRVRTVRASRDGLELDVEAPFEGLTLGESIAVDGACLTVKEVGQGWFSVNVVDTTLDRTRFASYVEGQPVNLERALQVGDRLGGHMVQGHVDGIGQVRRVEDRVDARVVDLEVPAEITRVLVPLGSITVDGVSMTVIAIPSETTVQLSLIPFTLQHTTLGRLTPGETVHIEGDVIGKYVARLLEPRTVQEGGRGE